MDPEDFLYRLLFIALVALLLTLGVCLVITVIKAEEPIDGNAAGPVRCDEPEVAVPESDAEIIAQILYHECRSLPALEQSAVIWVILNRVDSELSYFPDSVYDVCTQVIRSNGKETYMFAYKADAPIEEDLYLLAIDVLGRWAQEKAGETDVGRTLPSDYLYFWGDGRHNYFRKEYQGKVYWDWSLPDPYEEGEG